MSGKNPNNPQAGQHEAGRIRAQGMFARFRQTDNQNTSPWRLLQIYEQTAPMLHEDE